MTPDERQLLSGLFDRTRSAGSQPRDRDAESFINDAVRQQPYAPYLLSQTVLVQEQALRAANAKLEELQNKVQQYERDGAGGQTQGQGGGEGFLGSIGRSIFGSGASQQNRQAPPQGGYGQPPQYGQGQPQFGQGQPQYGQGGQPQGGPWGQAPQAPSGGGGFMRGALGMAAGVAGGALLGNAISGLFHGPGSNPFGIASGMGGGMGGMGGGETIVNNYYGDDAPPDGGGYDQAMDDGGGFDNGGDFGGDGGFDGGGGDDSYNV